MQTLKPLTLLSLLCGLALPALHGYAAEPQMRPGLWEIGASSNLLSLVEQVPPDQQRQLGNLARQYGFVMPDIKNGTARSQVCVTPEMAAQNVPPTSYHRQSGCETRNARQTGHTVTADLLCNGEQINGTGRAEATFANTENFTGKTSFKGSVHGVAVDEQVSTNGRWLAQSCATSAQP